MDNFSPLSRLLLQEKDRHAPVFYTEDGSVTWGEFRSDIARTMEEIRRFPHERWLLFCDDAYLFVLGFIALIYSGKSVIIASNSRVGGLEVIRGQFDHALTDVARFPYAHCRMERQPCTHPSPVFTPVNAEVVTITLFTSGSTGEPSAIVKPLACYETEVRLLQMMWPNMYCDAVALSSVPDYHAYGFVFHLLWPLSVGAAVLLPCIKYPEQLRKHLRRWRVTFISSPAFLRRWVEVGESEHFPKRDIRHIVSAGGELPLPVAQGIASCTRSPIREIYGSTETGVIAFRHFPDRGWRTIEGVHAYPEPELGQLMVDSPYAIRAKGFMMADKVEFRADGSFTLQGRVDTVIKIEEKRLSTQEMAGYCKRLGYFDEVRIVALRSPRKEMLGVVATLTGKGRNMLQKEGKAAFVVSVKTHLRHYFEPVLIPRKWRFVDEMPYNKLGKTTHSELSCLFEKHTTG